MNSTALAIRDAAQALDHLLVGTADLEQGVRWMQQQAGVRAVPGGSHPGVGTRNAPLFRVFSGYKLGIIRVSSCTHNLRSLR